ncbi:hypothetical protein AM1_G0050 (plasmid) [Acaryochloris marina MBIC11017]|uniref:Uncharacterized protein n=1 Tax=Acaryochloris marina (strain MBIC 11017) TaxID=329726 RepID=A8ZQE4_ACAM1|nr:hypothetical protein AM1_G0050 [Acaryochloris marina MBIC11017]
MTSKYISVPKIGLLSKVSREFPERLDSVDRKHHQIAGK